MANPQDLDQPCSRSRWVGVLGSLDSSIGSILGVGLLQLGGLVGCLGCLLGTAAQAQVIPDGTLGAEQSVVRSGVDINGAPADLIEGGAFRGANLFHSFSTFNINDGQRLYFANPSGIANIFSRVTGGGVSNINGLLGVDGSANLFLLNPNGIVFGPNAQLDIRGSFQASTADGIVFADGGVFSATVPSSSLLSVSVPVGVQYNRPTAGTLVQAGNLTVGEDLNLDAQILQMNGQLSASGNITLQAQEYIQTGSTFSATAEGTLLAQANQALNLDGSFTARRDLVFQSPIRVLADGTYATNGYFITLSPEGEIIDWLIPHDQVILADGNVTLAGYTGPSLHILAGGSVTLGNMVINGPAPSQRSFTIDTGLGSSQVVGVSSLNQGVLDVRSGFDWLGIFGTLPGNFSSDGINPVFAPVVNPSASNDIDLGPIRALGRDVYIFSDGDITTTGDINTFSLNTIQRIDAGHISLTAQGDITLGGALRSFVSSSVTDAGNGGRISLYAQGNITSEGRFTVNSFSNSTFRTAGEGGDISIYAAGDITSTNGFLVNSSSSGQLGRSGNGGDISIVADGQIINGNNAKFYANSTLLLGLGSAGDGGDIAIYGNRGITSTGSFRVTSASQAPSNPSDGGDIFLTTNEDITINGTFLDLVSASLAESGTASYGGDIMLYAGGSIITESNSFLFSGSDVFEGTAGNGGNVSLYAGDDITSNDYFNITASSITRASGSAGNGGDISLYAGDNITNTENYTISSVSFSQDGSVGAAGDISLYARSGNISVQNSSTILSFSISNNPSLDEISGSGGDITLVAQDSISGLNIITTSFAEAGSVQIIGTNSLTLTDVNILTGNTVALEIVPIPDFSSLISVISESIEIDGNERGQSGIINISSPSDVTLNRTAINSSTGGVDPAGDISISAPGSIIFSDSQISTNTLGSGPAGDTTLEASEIQFVDPNSGLFAFTGGSGPAGNITLQASPGNPDIMIFLAEGAQINASAGLSSTGQGGSVAILAPGSITLSGNGEIAVETAGAGPAGDVLLQAPTLTMQDDLRISSTATALATPTAEPGGSFIVNVSELNLLGTGGLFAETEGAADAGTITLTPYGSDPNLTITFQNGGQISSSTRSQGAGGSILLTAPGSMTIQGDGRIASDTSGLGDAGNVVIATGDLLIQDQATVSVSSSTVTAAASPTGTVGDAGNIAIDARSVTLDNQASLEAVTASGEGGNISLAVEDVLLMRNDSVISTEAGGSGNGGNIDITADFIVTVPNENNDIIANAVAGNGGNITLTAQRIIGFTPRSGFTTAQLRSNGTSDLSASSQLGTEGTVSILNLGIDPSQGLTELPVAFSDASNQIIEGCRAGGEMAQGEFVITGRGGLPPTPTDPLTAEPTAFPWATPDLEQTTGIDGISQVEMGQSTLASPTPALVEAQGWVRDLNGEMLLVADPAVGVSPATRIAAVTCSIPKR